MTVQELIDKLKEFDPNLLVMLVEFGEEYTETTLDVEDLKEANHAYFDSDGMEHGEMVLKIGI